MMIISRFVPRVGNEAGLNEWRCAGKGPAESQARGTRQTVNGERTQVEGVGVCVCGWVGICK